MLHLIVVTIAFIFAFAYLRHGLALQRSRLPVIGRPDIIGFIYNAIRFTLDSRVVLREGREKFQGQPFLVPTLSGYVIVLGREHADLLRLSNDKTVSIRRYTWGPFHVALLSSTSKSV